MKQVVFYSLGTAPDDDDEAGEILFIKRYEDSVATSVYDAEKPSYSAWIIDTLEEAFMETHYVNLSGTPTITLRPVATDEEEVHILNDGIDTFTFTMPAGTTVSDFQEGTVTTYASSEAFTFTTEIEGDWLYEFSFPFPYRSHVVRISTAYADD